MSFPGPISVCTGLYLLSFCCQASLCPMVFRRQRQAHFWWSVCGHKLFQSVDAIRNSHWNCNNLYSIELLESYTWAVWTILAMIVAYSVQGASVIVVPTNWRCTRCVFQGMSVIEKRWAASGVQWSDFVPASQNIAEFLKDHVRKPSYPRLQ